MGLFLRTNGEGERVSDIQRMKLLRSEPRGFPPRHRSFQITLTNGRLFVEVESNNGSLDRCRNIEAFDSEPKV